MRMHRATGACLLLGLLSLAAAAPARAQTCPPLRMLAQIRMVPVNDGTKMLVPVTINGADKFMVFDTGAAASSLTHAAADALGLSVYTVERERGGALYDVNGEVSRTAASVADFRLGGQQMGSVQFRIWPDPEMEKAGPDLAGILSPRELLSFDVDADFSSRILTLFSPDHCEGNVLYWKAGLVSAGDIEMRDDGHIHVPAALDGQELDAIIDSGATISVLSAAAARRSLGLTPSSPGMEPSPSLTKYPQYPVYRHRFAKLDFNGVTVLNPVVAIWPEARDRSERSMQSTGNRAMPPRIGVKPAQLIIGMDVLSKLHAYFAFREHRLYVSGGTTAPK